MLFVKKLYFSQLDPIRRRLPGVFLLITFSFLTSPPVQAQSLGNAGTIVGTVVDPSGAAVVGASVTINNPVTGYTQSTTTGSDGSFRFTNIPPNPYRLEVKVSGFSPFIQDLEIRN